MGYHGELVGQDRIQLHGLPRGHVPVRHACSRTFQRHQDRPADACRESWYQLPLQLGRTGTQCRPILIGTRRSRRDFARRDLLSEAVSASFSGLSPPFLHSNFYLLCVSGGCFLFHHVFGYFWTSVGLTHGLFSLVRLLFLEQEFTGPLSL